jgi:amidase
MTVMRTEIASVHADLYASHADAYAPHISELIETGSKVAASDYLRALRYRYRFRRELEESSSKFDVLVAPAAVGGAEASLDTIGPPVMNLLATFAGLPAITLPAALNESGLPLGVQLIGHQDGDEQLLGIAAAVEERLGFQRPELPIAAAEGSSRIDTRGRSASRDSEPR